MMTNEIHLLRSFMPEFTHYGLNDAMYDNKWVETAEFSYTFFRTLDQIVQVIFSYNSEFNCTELSFKTVLAHKVNSLEEAAWYGSYLPDPDMTLDCNRGTVIFRKVVFLALLKSRRYDKIVFSGATPFLDRIYTRLDNLEYFICLAANHGFNIEKEGRNIFLIRNKNETK